MVLVQVCADFCAHRAGGRGAVKGSIVLGEIGYIPTHTVPSGHRCVGAAGLSSGEDTPMGEISGACDFCAGRWRGACARPGRVLSSLVGRCRKRVRLVGKPRTIPIRASTFTCRERAVLQPQATAAARRLDHTTTWPPTQKRARQLLLAPWPSEQRCHGNVIATCTGLVLTTRTSFLPTFSARPGHWSCPGPP